MSVLEEYAEELLEVERITWDVPSVFSVLVFGNEPAWCRGWRKHEYPYVEYKQALLGEPYGAVSMIVIGGFDDSKVHEYTAMVWDIQVSLPNTHLVVDPDTMPLEGIAKTVTTLFYDYSEAKSPWHTDRYVDNHFDVAIPDAHLTPAAAALSLVARRGAIKDWLQREHNNMVWQCQHGYGMYTSLVRVPPKAESGPLRVRVNCSRPVALGHQFIEAVDKLHYTVNIVSLKDLIDHVDAKRSMTAAKDTFEVLNKYAFRDSGNRSIVNFLVVDTLDTDTTSVVRDIDYITECIANHWYLLGDNWTNEDVQQGLFWHVTCLEKFHVLTE